MSDSDWHGPPNHPAAAVADFGLFAPPTRPRTLSYTSAKPGTYNRGG